MILIYVFIHTDYWIKIQWKTELFFIIDTNYKEIAVTLDTHKWLFFVNTDYKLFSKDKSEISISNKGKANSKNFLFRKLRCFATSKRTLTTIILENNYFLCVSKPLKFH